MDALVLHLKSSLSASSQSSCGAHSLFPCLEPALPPFAIHPLSPEHSLSPRMMELGNILNTKFPAKAVAGTHFAMQHAMQHEQLQQHFGPTSYLNGRIKSENGSDRGVSPHPSDSSRYSSQAPQPLQSYPPPMTNNMNGMRYPSPSQMQTSIPLLNNPNYIPNPPDHAYPQQATPDPQQQQLGGRPASDTGPPKAFACSTCAKGFARRSDLARHGMVEHFSKLRTVMLIFL